MTVTRRLLLSIIPAAAAPFVGLPGRALADADPTRAERSIGKPDAKVSVHEYFSLTCTHCAAFAQTTLPQVKTKLIDPGSVRWVFHDYPLDQVALTAAVVARYLPVDRYEPFVDALFATQDRWAFARGSNPTEQLWKTAGLAGMSRQVFDKAVADTELRDLDSEAAAGRSGQMEDRLDSKLCDRRSEIRWGNGLRGLSKTDPRVNAL